MSNTTEDILSVSDTTEDILSVSNTYKWRDSSTNPTRTRWRLGATEVLVFGENSTIVASFILLLA